MRIGGSCYFFKDVANTKASVWGNADGSDVRLVISFYFVFIFIYDERVYGNNWSSLQKLWQKSQDTINAMDDVATKKRLIRNLRDHGWSKLLEQVITFLVNKTIIVPDISG